MCPVVVPYPEAKLIILDKELRIKLKGLKMNSKKVLTCTDMFSKSGVFFN